MRRVLNVIAIGAAALILTGCGGSADAEEESTGSDTFYASGTVTQTSTLVSSYSDAEGQECRGDGETVDLQEGAQITVFDSDGKPVALGELSAGTWVEGVIHGPHLKTFYCEFTFAVTDIPITGDIYSIEVGQHGKTQFTLEEADQLAIEIAYRG